MATSVPLVEYLCSEVIYPLHAILLNYSIHLEFNDFWGFFGNCDVLPCPFFFFCLLGSSPKERVEIETLQLAIT